MRNAAAVIVSTLVLGAGCGPADRGRVDACVGLECQVASCAARGLPPTTISGTALAPNGALALAGVTVYVPASDPGPLPDGVQCSRCDAALAGGAVTNTLSTATGAFTLPDAPSGQAIPLVLQVGKWRRQVEIPEVVACQDNPLPPALTALPRNQAEGDLPRVAISTGEYDALECLLRKLGVDDTEFTPDGGAGRIHLYASNGIQQRAPSTPLPSVQTLWGDLAKLSRYDVALFSCEGDQLAAEKSQAAMDALKAYADRGGRVFLSHWQHIWIDGDPASGKAPAAWPALATCGEDDAFAGTALGTIDQSDNPKGATFAAWMQAVGGSTSPGVFTINDARRTCLSIDRDRTERWVYFLEPSGEVPQTFQFTTPIEQPVAARCGRVVMSDMHVSADSIVRPAPPFPGACSTAPLTPQEKALAFMLFDISSCVGPLL